MQNIELKVFVPDFKNIIFTLNNIGAEYKNKLNQIDTYYKISIARLKLRETNNANFELIYYERPDEIESKLSKYEILKIEDNELEKIKLFLKNSFSELVTVEKSRDLWIYKNTRIHLDSVSKLGKFLELETTVKNITLEQAQEEYDNIVKILNLNIYKKYNKSYSDLLLESIN